ncbi:MAG: dihydrofolate reductase, partial [Bacteroidales bacterium]
MKSTPSVIDRFADISIIRYALPPLAALSPRTLHLIYALSEAALCGRDIFYAQNYRYNLMVRHALEAIYTGCVNRPELPGFQELELFLKRFWFANGIHHHNSGDKLVPGFTAAHLEKMARISKVFEKLLWLNQTYSFDMGGGKPPVSMTAWENLCDILFRPERAPKSVSKEIGSDRLLASSCNYYRGVSEKEAVAFYEAMTREEEEPLWYGLNSLLYRDPDGRLAEAVYKVGGLYGKAIARITHWLLRAAESAETPLQATALEWLIRYYESGDLRAFNEYNKAWVAETALSVDSINGFIEVYGDPLGRKASWESVVFVKDREASKRTEALSREAAWFEANAPIDEAFKKREVKGVTASVISVVMLGGDCAPASPLGINLPNANWIRSRYGS